MHHPFERIFHEAREGNERDPRFFDRHCGEGREGRHFGRGGEHGPRVHFGMFGGRREGRFGGGQRERMFDGGELQLVILELLAAKPSYGYELIKSLEERLAGAYSPSPGVVYPTLTLLEERGFATSASEGGKKVFTITDAGHEELAASADRLADINARLEQSGERFGRGRSPEIMKAFMNLRDAMQSKMVRGKLTRDQIAKVAAAINTAAETIDKV
jgi:DNA-binding PadR family transcriptional regulator